MKFLQPVQCDSPYPVPTPSEIPAPKQPADLASATCNTSAEAEVTYDGFAFLRRHQPGLGTTRQALSFSSNGSSCTFNLIKLIHLRPWRAAVHVYRSAVHERAIQ